MPTTDGIETSTTGDMPRGQALAGGADEGGASPPQETDEGGVLPLRLPPPWLDRVMLLVYPASLGLDEGIAHLTLRAMNAMLNQARCPHWHAQPLPFLYGQVVVSRWCWSV